ncbi:hypothetical protein [Nocardia sp. NPDC127526]|uniref:hypothetical protein n=1 Tax=Nocardia sp. NPDC127526 TaxID=3345393 RepID=UPI003636D5B2
MNDWATLTPTRLVFAGDWHANPWHSVRAVEWAAEQQVQAILHVGDDGYDFNPGFWPAFNTRWSRRVSCSGSWCGRGICMPGAITRGIPRRCAETTIGQR